MHLMNDADARILAAGKTKEYGRKDATVFAAGNKASVLKERRRSGQRMYNLLFGYTYIYIYIIILPEKSRFEILKYTTRDDSLVPDEDAAVLAAAEDEAVALGQRGRD
jgi:hypothetical protein